MWMCLEEHESTRNRRACVWRSQHLRRESEIDVSGAGTDEKLGDPAAAETIFDKEIRTT